MAAFTSVGNGNWNDGPTTWGTAAGVYPGSTASQADTAKISHNVSMNVTSLAGTVTTVTVDAGKKLSIDANHTATGDFTGNWTVNGEVEFNKASGTYSICIGPTTITINSGGTWDMDATAAGCKQILYLESSTTEQGGAFASSSGSTVVMTGRTKSGARTTNTGALTAASSNTITVADDGGWEQGDTILIWRGRTSGKYEERTLGTKVSGTTWNLDTTVTNSYVAGCQVDNLTRSCVVKCITANRNGKVTFSNTGLTLSDAEFYRINGVRLSASGLSATRCSAWGYLYVTTNVTGWYNSSANVTYTDCMAYCSHVVSNTSYGFQLFGVVPMTTLDGCGALIASTGSSSTAIILSSTSAYSNIMTDCICAGVVGINIGGGCHYLTRCYMFDGTTGIYGCFDGHFIDCVFGEDPAGNAVPNATRDVYVSSGAGTNWFERCRFESSTEYSGTAGSYVNRMLSLNHEGTSGYTLEYQYYGVIESNAVQARTGTYCLSCDPSSATMPLRLILSFPVASGKTPVLKFYAKGSGTSLTPTVTLGMHSAGLSAVTASSGSLDANRQFSLTTSYVEKTVNFSGTTDCNGSVEVFIDILDASSEVMYIDDISVSGNL